MSWDMRSCPKKWSVGHEFWYVISKSKNTITRPYNDYLGQNHNGNPLKCIINTNWHILKVIWDMMLLLMYRQRQTDRSNICEYNKRVDYDYEVGDKVLIRKDGILR